MKNKNLLFIVPFVSYLLFIFMVYQNVNIASFIFFFTIIVTIGTTIFLFRNESSGNENVEKN